MNGYQNLVCECEELVFDAFINYKAATAITTTSTRE